MATVYRSGPHRVCRMEMPQQLACEAHQIEVAVTKHTRMTQRMPSSRDSHVVHFAFRPEVGPELRQGGAHHHYLKRRFAPFLQLVSKPLANVDQKELG